MDYGCDVSNRYMGYLDSSDHGTSQMSSATGKTKRKTKKKRKPKNTKFIEKCINTIADHKSESTDIGDVIENHHHQYQQQQQLQQESFSNDSGCDKTVENDQQMTMNHETDSNSTDFPKSLPSCDSLIMQSDILQDEVTGAIDSKFDTADTVNNDKDRKWSVICFEEEKSLLKQEHQPNRTEEKKDQESQSKEDDFMSNILNEPELAYGKQRVYPTLYFYNSSFGNRNRRTVDWHNSDRRINSKNHKNHNNITNNTNNININIENNTEKNNYERKKKRRNGRRQKKFTSTGTEDNNWDGNQKNEMHLVDDKYTDSNNESNDRSSQHTNESNTISHREYINLKNRYNQIKHGAQFHSEQTFTQRRPSEFVRNV